MCAGRTPCTLSEWIGFLDRTGWHDADALRNWPAVGADWKCVGLLLSDVLCSLRLHAGFLLSTDMLDRPVAGQSMRHVRLDAGSELQLPTEHGLSDSSDQIQSDSQTAQLPDRQPVLRTDPGRQGTERFGMLWTQWLASAISQVPALRKTSVPLSRCHGGRRIRRSRIECTRL